MKSEIRDILLRSGAVAVGFAEAGEVEDCAQEEYRRWLEAGCHASMEYMEAHFGLRRDPRLLLQGAATVISLAFSYLPAERRDDSGGYIACYAYGKDYHKALRKLLKAPLAEISAAYGGEYRICIDSAPIMERYWAERSGIGFRGCNGALIVPGHGSMVFLAEILTTLEIVPDELSEGKCLDCGRCVAVCPGRALDGSGTVDSRRCINYLTIEHKGEWLDPEARETMNTPEGRETLFGCDRCLRVCPYNRDLPPTEINEFRLCEPARSLSRDSISSMTEEEFERLIVGTPVRRAGYSGLRRNARVE